MKFIGAGLVWASIFLTGIKISERYERRSYVFNALTLMVEEIINGICYLSIPIGEVFIGIEESGLCKTLTFLEVFKSLSKEGEDFPLAWKHSLERTTLPLKKSEKDRIISLGLSIGRTDSENQKRLLKMYFSQFSTYAEEAYAQRKKYSFTASFSGLLFGGAVFILLI